MIQERGGDHYVVDRCLSVSLSASRTSEGLRRKS